VDSSAILIGAEDVLLAEIVDSCCGFHNRCYPKTEFSPVSFVMLRFEASLFAVVGVIASAVPVVIHLLSRRRFKTVPWAAMDFLHDAQKRQRKTLRLRDALLLAIRVLALLLVGLVLSKPILQGSNALWTSVCTGVSAIVTLAFAVAWATAPRRRPIPLAVGTGFGLLVMLWQISAFLFSSPAEAVVATNAKSPVHAVLIVDNSRSMGVVSLKGTALDRAKAKAIEFIKILPPDSKITVVPLAGSENPVMLDPYRNQDDARRALDRIQLVDVEGNIVNGLELAEQACQQTVDPVTKRVVLLTDLQANAWTHLTAESFRHLPGLQVMNVGNGSARNVWISGLHVEDGLASTEVPCRFLARIRSSHMDLDQRSSPGGDAFDVQVKLLIEGVAVTSQTISMSSGQEREVELTYQFERQADPQQLNSAVAAVVVQTDISSADQLPDDNRQQVVVPIVASLPVVFVDQYGDEEDLERNRIGETYALRHLMAPRSTSSSSEQRLIEVEHLRAEQVTQQRLQTARLIVVAGLEKPDDDLVTLLRDFVRQGGPLVILAGGQFDPAAWSEHGWLSGRGILPAPLDSAPLGQLPEVATQPVRPFFASFASMQHDFFQIEGEDQATLTSLFEFTPFFKAVRVELSQGVLDQLLEQETRRYAEEQRFLETYRDQLSRRDANRAVVHDTDQERKYRQIEPSWWKWRSPLSLTDRSLAAAELAQRGQPRVLASYDGNHGPFVVERRIDAGRVLFFSSGVTSNWNLLRSSVAMYLFHRTFCQLIEHTFPSRNFVAGEKILLPIERRYDARYVVTRPSGATELLNIDSISSTVSGVSIRYPVQAGTYVIAAEQLETQSADARPDRFEEVRYAVNGAESESDLTLISREELRKKLGMSDVLLSGSDEAVQLEADSRSHRNLWKTFGWCLLICLLAEQAILAFPLVTAKPLKS
jgi:hypothetical protein